MLYANASLDGSGAVGLVPEGCHFGKVLTPHISQLTFRRNWICLEKRTCAVTRAEKGTCAIIWAAILAIAGSVTEIILSRWNTCVCVKNVTYSLIQSAQFKVFFRNSDAKY